MNHLSQAMFNILINSGCSFIAGILVVALAIWLFKIDNSRWKLFLLSLPSVKIIWDIVSRKIPLTSIVNAGGLNPLLLPPKHQNLMIGGGFSQYGPIFNVMLSAKSLDGKEYSTSLADYLYYWLVKRFGETLPKFILIGMLCVSFVFLVRRVWSVIGFEMERRKIRKDATNLETRISDFRKIDIYSSGYYTGTPFTGGILKPYICLPEDALTRLNPEEKNAVIQHEVAHIRHWDILVTMFIKVIGDLFWFIPAYLFLSRKIDRLREVLADQTAVGLGASRAHLASALLKLKEIPEDSRHGVLYSAFFRERSLLKTRVQCLLEQENENRRSRFGWNKWFVKVLVAVWVTGGVMMATFGGNHEVNTNELPQWIKPLLHKIGLM